MNDSMKRLGKKILNNMIFQERFGWPPDCVGVIFQPQRPINKSVENTNHKKIKGDYNEV